MRNQLDTLTRAFLVRFFESDITSGTDDLKGAFFWLLATLAVPGLFIPWIMAFDWQLLARIEGAEAVRIASRAEKTFYLGYAMIASGILTTIAWSSILPDKRDTLILGALPVQPRTIVVAKLFALIAYMTLVATFMHGVCSVFWGLILADDVSLTFALRGIAAHFVASSAASAAVCFTVAALQGLALATVGPRHFARVSIALQVLLVVLIALCLAALPSMTSSIVRALAGAPDQQWTLAMPPVWFLGIYERLLGTSETVLIGLSRTALAMFAVPLAVATVTYPLAYRRLMVSVVETGSDRGNALGRAVQQLIVRAAGRHASARAAADFFLATLARVERQRFILAIALGLAVAWGLPGWRAYVPGGGPKPALLALPFASMMFLLAGLRIASSLPADVRAGWLFEAHDLSRRYARQALERTMILIGIVPPLALSAAVFWNLWGTRVALTHAVVMASLGVALIELLIWHAEGMPCGQRWTPARANLGRRWPLHLALFLIVTGGAPKLEMILFRNVYGTAVVIVDLLLLAGVARYASARHRIIPIYEEIDPVAGVLRLN